jgi:hypothetical protein
MGKSKVYPKGHGIVAYRFVKECANPKNSGDCITPNDGEGTWWKIYKKSQRLRKYQEKKARCQTTTNAQTSNAS